MIYVDSPLVWDPSLTSSAQHSHKSDTDSSTKTPQEALNPISNKRCGHKGEILGGHTSTNQTQAAEWKKHACRQEGPERHVAPITLPVSSSMPLLPFLPLFITSSVSFFNSSSQHQPGYFLPIFFYLLSLSPLSACISRSSKASKRAPRSLQLETWRVPIYIPMSYPYPSDSGPPTWNTGWIYLIPCTEALLSTVKISAKAT